MSESAKSPRWKSCSNREKRRGARNALLARRITWQPYPGMESSPSSLFVTRGVRHCSTLSTMMASLILVVARDWALTEDSGGGCGRKSREGDEDDENKDERKETHEGRDKRDILIVVVVIVDNVR